MELQEVERSVWQAVAEPEQVAQWLLPPMLGAQMRRDESGTVRVYMGEMRVPVARQEVVDAPQRLVSRSLPDQLLTTTNLLTEENGGTRLTVTVSGFEALPESARQDRLGPCGMGWEKALANLEAYLAGATLPFPEGYVATLSGYRREAKGWFAIERSIWIDAPRERVWRAVTDPKEMQQWFSPNTPWEMTALEVGGRFYVRDPETNAEMYTQMIEVIDPPHRFVTRSLPAAPDVSHIVTYTSQEERGGTRLIVTDAGYELETEERRAGTMEQNAFGFGMMLENLQAYAESKPLPYPWGF